MDTSTMSSRSSRGPQAASAAQRRTDSATTPGQARTTMQDIRFLYLVIYNCVFAYLWFQVLATALFLALDNKKELFATTEILARWIQTLALLEIVHAATGLVSAPVGTTALQVVSRVIIVWMVWYGFPQTTAASPAFFRLVVAWSIADIVRYLYYVCQLVEMTPRWLVWLRYTMFYPLYPIGMASEWWLLWIAVEPARRVNPALPYLFYFCLMLYVPGGYTMYIHMIKQRQKVLRKQTKVE